MTVRNKFIGNGLIRMELHVRKNSRVRTALGTQGTEFLCFAVNAVERILPHVETTQLKVVRGRKETGAAWDGNSRRGIKLVVSLPDDPKTNRPYYVRGLVKRRRLHSGVGSIERTLDKRERDICERVLKRIAQVLRSATPGGEDSLAAIRTTFDEQVVAAHLRAYHGLRLNPSELLAAVRGLAEQSYENKSITFGCLIASDNNRVAPDKAVFPRDYFALKKFRLFSDGYRTAYRVSSAGCLLSFEDLDQTADVPGRNVFYPEWCEEIACASRDKSIGISLTRQGDILVFDGGTLRFSYRLGSWRYWNHNHLIDLLRNAARAQCVAPKSIPRVVRALYRSSLDVSFRRTGGLFVLLRNQGKVRSLVRLGDALADRDRRGVECSFDNVLPTRSILTLSRRTIAELASADGAIVLNKKGEILAYGAVLEPKRRGTIQRSEGSRTKAAIGASNYGIAVKISSDGDITVYFEGTRFVHV